MMKEVLRAFAVGVSFAVGVFFGGVICYGGYRLYKYYKEQNETKEKDIFAEKLKAKEAQSQKLKDLIANQTYVELLTTKELTSWFKENKNRVAANAQMIITTPTVENMRGLGYPAETDLDAETNIVQLFYDEESGKALLIRLVNYAGIDSNLQAKLIENEGMIVVTE